MQVKQLDFKRTQSILSRLAKFHAGSMAIEEENPGTVSSKFQVGSLLRPDMVIHIKECFGMFSEAVGQWEGCVDWADRVAILLDDFDVAFRKVFSMEKNHINVLNHGTLHNRNVMYKEDGDDFVILDYQMCIFGSPALDLIFTLFLIGQPGLDHNVLVEYYCKELLNAIDKLGLRVQVSQADLNMDMESHKFLGN